MNHTAWLFDTPATPPNLTRTYLFDNFLIRPKTDADYMASPSRKKGRYKFTKKGKFDDSLPSVERVGRSRGNAPRNNREQNRQIDALAKRYGLTNEQRERLHARIGGRGYGYKEIEKIIQGGDYFQEDVEVTGTKSWLFELPFPERADYMAAPGKLRKGKPSNTKPQISVPKPTAVSGRIALETAPLEIRKMKWERGIYVIFRDGKQVYVGKADKTRLAIRIAQHRTCLRHLRIPTTNYEVKVFHFPHATAEQIHVAERNYRHSFPKDFSHQRNTEWEDVPLLF
jgi:hypothetical protein